MKKSVGDLVYYAALLIFLFLGIAAVIIAGPIFNLIYSIPPPGLPGPLQFPGSMLLIFFSPAIILFLFRILFRTIFKKRESTPS